jgi:uncharacterized protein
LLSLSLKRLDMVTLISPALVSAVRHAFRLEWQGIHGAGHWARVRWRGLAIASSSGADTRVVEYFAFLHDVGRDSDGDDRDHGLRAAHFARSIRSRLILLPDRAFAQLEEAIVCHTHVARHPDVTIQTCWDADRLDLGRVGVRPDPARMGTEAAKRMAHELAAKALPLQRFKAAWC